MNQNSQMIAMVRTLLYFMGKQMYMPSATDVLPILQEALASQPLVDPKSAPLSWNNTGPVPTGSKIPVSTVMQQEHAKSSIKETRMKKLAFFAATFLLATQFAHAETNQAKTLTCSGGLSVPFKSFYFETPGSSLTTGTAPFLSITADLAQFLPLFQANVTGKHFADCELQLPGQQSSASTLKFTEVYVQLVSITSDRDTRYVTATFNISKFEYLAANGAASTNGATALTPEQQNKALTEFLARAPKPSGN